MTLFRLGREQGRDVFDMAEQMTADQLTWYAAYHQLEPFTFIADDVRTAITSHASVAAMCKNPPKIGKFIPQWDTEELRLDATTSNATIRAFVEAQNRALMKHI